MRAEFVQHRVGLQPALRTRFSSLLVFSVCLLKRRYDPVSDVAGAVIPAAMTRPISRLRVVVFVDQGYNIVSGHWLLPMAVYSPIATTRPNR